MDNFYKLQFGAINKITVITEPWKYAYHGSEDADFNKRDICRSPDNCEGREKHKLGWLVAIIDHRKNERAILDFDYDLFLQFKEIFNKDDGFGPKKQSYEFKLNLDYYPTLSPKSILEVIETRPLSIYEQSLKDGLCPCLLGRLTKSLHCNGKCQ